jgi:hypothetical protein
MLQENFSIHKSFRVFSSGPSLFVPFLLLWVPCLSIKTVADWGRKH